jgi:hypothetical protein
MYWWNRVVEFDRKPIDRDLLCGFVLEFTDRLTLIGLLDEDRFDLDGYVVFRNSDVRRWRPVREDSVLVRALRLKGIKPVRKRGLSIASWPEVLKTANALFPLIAISREVVHRNACQVGRLFSMNRVSFELKEILTDGSWDVCYRYKFRDLSRVEFGSGYADALARVAAADAASRPRREKQAKPEKRRG